MVRSPSVHDEEKLKKGPWMPEEDQKLVDCINKHGHASWRAVPKLAGLNRCGKSCRLRWKNYLQPDIRRGKFSDDEEKLIINLHSVLGNKWSKIASHLPGRTDNEIKNFWNTNISKKLLQMGIDPKTHKPRTDLNHLSNLSQLLCSSQFGNFMINPLDLLRPQTNTTQLANFHVLQNLLQVLNTTTLPSLNYNSTPNIRSHNFCPNSLSPTFINSKLPTNFEEIVGSSMLNDCGFDQQGVGANNNNNVISSNLEYFNHANLETDIFSVPKLLSTSPSPETSSIVNHLETNNNISNATTPAHAFTMFQDWERLVNEETNWNDFLSNDLLDWKFSFGSGSLTWSSYPMIISKPASI